MDNRVFLKKNLDFIQVSYKYAFFCRIQSAKLGKNRQAVTSLKIGLLIRAGRILVLAHVSIIRAQEALINNLNEKHGFAKRAVVFYRTNSYF